MRELILPVELSCRAMDSTPTWRYSIALRLLCVATAPLLCASTVTSQAGDKKGELQPPLPAELRLPPPPTLSPEEAIESFTLESGFKIGLVASEPLIDDPVVAKFDEDGRLWVVEMKGYMPNPDGTGEEIDNGLIAVLEDEDGDGQMDKKTTFLHRLVLPRAIGFAPGGVIVLAPPDLLFCRDLDGDGEAEEVSRIDTGLGGIYSPEHAPNGLMRGIDNWIYLANHNSRYRFHAGKWEKSQVGVGGQWGLSKDDSGRLFFNYNSDPLRVDLTPSHYAIRHPGLGKAKGPNSSVLKQGPVWPVHLTPGVNRGYQKGLLNAGKLSRWTAACGPVIYRGTSFPPSFYGNAFICETAGNLVQRCIIEESDGTLKGSVATPDREFLASTDERFRPVNLFNGPDGNLFVVDFYRGIIQHRLFMTSFLRTQVEDRELATPLGLGRIWRISPNHDNGNEQPQMSTASSETLVQYLDHPQGWWRDTAQRVLVDRGDPAAIPALKILARKGSPLGRLHALWTLEGLNERDTTILKNALQDPDPWVNVAAIRILEPVLASSGIKDFRDSLATIARHGSIDSRRQLALSLSFAPFPGTEKIWAALLENGMSDAPLRTGALSGLQGLEIPLLEVLAEEASWEEKSHGRQALLHDLGRCVAAAGEEEDIAALIADFVLNPGTNVWQKESLLQGMVTGLPRGRTFTGLPPKSVRDLSQLQGSPLQSIAKSLQEKLHWVTVPETSAPQSPAFLAAQERGRRIFRTTCINCHQANGQGLDGLAPPLAGSEWLDKPNSELANIVTNGLDGPINVAGKSWDLVMPGIPSLSNKDVADVLTYIKFRWAKSPEHVLPVQVKKP